MRRHIVLTVVVIGRTSRTSSFVVVVSCTAEDFVPTFVLFGLRLDWFDLKGR